MMQISLCHLPSLRYLSTETIESGVSLPRIRLANESDKEEDAWYLETNKNGISRLRHVEHDVYFGAQAAYSSGSLLDPCTEYIPCVCNNPDPDCTEWIFRFELETDRLRLLHRSSNLFLRARRCEYDGEWNLDLVSDSSDPGTEWVRSKIDDTPIETNLSYQNSIAAWTVLFLFIAFGAYIRHLELS